MKEEDNTVQKFLDSLLKRASGLSVIEASTGNKTVDDNIARIVLSAERCKGVLAVLITLLVYKVLHKEQDVRYHQAELPNGFSGRGFDTKYITPFLNVNDFPAPTTTGWLTRSLEQPYPYLLNYQGKISVMKNEFLYILDQVQSKGFDPTKCLVRLFTLLIKQRDSEKTSLAKPHGLTITQIITYLKKHFDIKMSGTARLPVLAIYSAYQCMFENHFTRYADKTLLPLESHTTADSQSGRSGDIDIIEKNNNVFESIEIKHNIQISVDLIEHAYEKFKSNSVNRYYLLTTANMDSADWEAINVEIDKIKKQHGCQVIVNGVYPTLRYYLRLFENTDDFIAHYVNNLANDQAIKYPHKKAWNDIVSGRL